MVLVRTWRRRLYGGVGTAAFAPAVLLAALAVVAFGGGFGRLGVLTQAFAGPAAPSAPVAAAARPLSARVLTALATPTAAPVAAVRSGARPARPHVSAPRAVVPATPVGRAPPGSHHGGTTAPTSTSRPQPTRSTHRPTTVDRIVSAATNVTKKLPPPVGPTATNALQTLGSTVDKILPPVPHAVR